MYPDALAKKIFNILCDNANTRSKYLSCLTNLLLSSSSKNDALKWLSLIEDISNLDMEFWKNIQSHVNDNDVLLKTELLERLNKNFALFNIPNIVKNVPTATDADDFPF